LWYIYTTKLEPVLAKMSDVTERLHAVAKRQLRLKKFSSSLIEKENGRANQKTG